MAHHIKNIALRTSVLYALFAGLWILLSDHMISILFQDPIILTRLQTYKGLFYVLMTTILLYTYLHAQLAKWGQDANERQKAQQALSISNDYLKAILDSTNDAILVVDATNGAIVDANQRVFEIYGYTREEAIRKPIHQLSNVIQDYSAEKIIRWASKARIEGPQSMEWQTRQKDGCLLWVEVSLRFVVIGGQDRFVVSIRDINARKEMENSLKENQRMLATLISNLPGMVYRCKNNPNWTMEYISEGTFSLTGYRPNDFLGDANIAFGSIIHPDDQRMVWEEAQAAIHAYSPFAFAFRIIDASNIEKWVWEQGRGVYDENDQLLFLEGFIMDITEQKRAEEHLRNINIRLKVLINATPDIICFKDGQNRWLEANTADLELFRLTDVDYHGKTDLELADFTDPIYRDAFRACAKSDENAWQATTSSRGNEVIPLPGGGHKVYDVIKAPIYSPNGSREGLVVFGRDVTEQKKAEEELRISQQTYQGILSSVTEAVYIQQKNGVILDVNKAAETMHGYEHKEIIGHTPELLAAPGKNNLEKINEYIEKAYEGQAQRFEFWSMRKNGSIFPKEVTLSKGSYFGQEAVIAVARDISVRKQAEQALYKRLAELEALSTIDRTISSSFDLQITFDVLLKQTIKRLSVDAAAILIFDPDLQTLQYAAGQGFISNSFETAQIRPGQGYAGKVMLERRLISATNNKDVYQDPLFASLWKDENFETYYGIPLISKGQIKGVLEVFHRTELSTDSDWVNFLETLANQTAIAIDNSKMFYNLQHRNLELAVAYDATIEGWAHALELREGESFGHTERITDLTLGFAQALGVSSTEMVTLRRGVLLHDVGKMGIPDKILLKKGPLTRREWEVIKQHPQIAYDMLSRIDYLKQALFVPRYHHEKWDGSGYPEGLVGTQIPYFARIFAVIDVWDALTNDRPYRKRWSKEETMIYIREQSGKHFDPEIVPVFLKLYEEKDLGQL